MTALDLPGLRSGLDDAHWQSADLWLAMVGLGCNLDVGDVARFTTGALEPTGAEYELLAAALNEHLAGPETAGPARTWDELHRPPAVLLGVPAVGSPERYRQMTFGLVT